MKNFKHDGEIVELTAPAGGVVSGQAYLFGTSLLVVAQASVAAGETFAGLRKGAVTLPKLTTDVMAVGNKVNWNDTNEELQNATSDLDNCATIVKAAGNGDTEVEVALTPV